MEGVWARSRPPPVTALHPDVAFLPRNARTARRAESRYPDVIEAVLSPWNVARRAAPLASLKEPRPGSIEREGEGEGEGKRKNVMSDTFLNSVFLITCRE